MWLKRWSCSWSVYKELPRQFSVSASSRGAAGRRYDVVIAGGGIMGCSSAFYLARRKPGKDICVIERDPKVRS